MKLRRLWAAAGLVLAGCAPDGEVAQSEQRLASVPAPLRELDATDAAVLVVKFRDTDAAPAGGLSAIAALQTSSAGLVLAYGGSLHPALEDSDGRLAQLRERAADRSGRTQPRLDTLFELHGIDDAAALGELAQALRDDPSIEFAFLRGGPPPPPTDLAPPTPSYADQQLYLEDEVGVDAVGAWEMGFDGAGIRVADVEYGWNPTHEEFNEIDLHLEPGQTVAPEAFDEGYAPDHGTAALGILVGSHGGYGIDGIVPAVDMYTHPEWTVERGFRRAEAIANALAGLEPGDVLLLEMQIGEAVTGSFGPAELDDDVWMLTRMGVDAGIVVVAASGNGGLDLDQEGLAYYRDRGDSGALIVGAGDPMSRDALPYSTFGQRVNLQGWGSGVFTTGYGEYANLGMTRDQTYTADFQGSSAAAPMVAAAAVVVQQAAKSVGEPLEPEIVERILIATGRPQGEGGNVGPLPNLTAAAAVAMNPEGMPPVVAITDPPEDVEIGVAPGALFETDIEIEASDNSGFLYGVEVLVNGEMESVADVSAPYRYPGAAFPVGTWELVAVATDAWGNQTQSEPRVLVVVEQTEVASSGKIESTGLAVGTETDEMFSDTELPTSTTGAQTPQGDGDDGGCGCSAISPPKSWAGVGLLGLLLVGLRRRS